MNRFPLMWEEDKSTLLFLIFTCHSWIFCLSCVAETLWRCSSSNEYKMVARIRLIAQTSKPKGSLSLCRDIIQRHTQQSSRGEGRWRKVFSPIYYLNPHRHRAYSTWLSTLLFGRPSDARKRSSARSSSGLDSIPFFTFFLVWKFKYIYIYISFSFLFVQYIEDKCK